MPYALASLVGLLLGSLLNLLADALPEGRSPRRPACPHCGRPHPPHRWLAVGDYLLGGRCVHCGAPRRLRHAVVELASALALAYLWSRFGMTARFFFTAAIVEILFLVTVIDIEHRLILRVVIYPAWFVALAAGLLDPSKGIAKTLIGGAVGYGVMLVFYLLARPTTSAIAKLRGRDLDEVPFGWGDVNLAAFIGLAVGWSGIVLALFIGVLAGGIGALVFLAVMLVRRKVSLFMPIPYGPFLSLGGLAVLLWGQALAAWYLGR